MRILQIVPSISLVYGGPSQMVQGLSAALAAQDVEVTVLTTNANGDAGQPPLDVPLNVPVMHDGYQVRYFRCSPFRRYKFSLDLLRWLGQHAVEYNLAHIHALFSPVSTAAATVARQQHLPYIMRPLGTLDPADLRKKRLLKQLYGTLLERPNLAGAAGVHFTSQQECQVSERFGTVTQDIIVPLGVNSPTPLPKGQGRQMWGIADKPLLLFMSRLDPKKGLNLLIPALEGLLAKGVEFQFVLAGANPQDPNYEHQIREKIANSPLSSHTRMTGFVTGEQKAALLQDADVFVLPSYYENFGIAVVEAMVVGVPVVISEHVYIWREISEAEAGWVCGCEIEALMRCLQEALSDRAEARRRGENAREYAMSHYSWEAIAAQMIECYRQIMTRSAPIQYHLSGK